MKTLVMTLCLLAGGFSTASYAQATSNKVQQQKKKAVAVRLSKQAFKSKLETVSNAQLVDVRTPEEFAAGTINGAVNMNYYGTDFQEQLQSLDPTKPVFIFCKSGGRSSQALNKMAAMGFQEVYELEGGYSGWAK